MTKIGTVFFVGAGPGDPELMTIKGANVLKKADVIVYDRLVNNEILEYANPLVELIYCGKMPDNHHIPQDQINEIIIENALRGKTVVRLKGGDPSIFGRVGEEAEYCVDHNVPFVVVPGITSSISASMYAGIPLTHRDFSSSCAFITGHKGTNNKRKEIQWEKLSTSVDTLVFYMGVGNIKMIQEKLLFHGRPAITPVALVRWGTMENQETLTGTLENISQKVAEAQFRSPAIIVVGEVVKLRKKLAWFEENKAQSLPLAQV